MTFCKVYSSLCFCPRPCLFTELKILVPTQISLFSYAHDGVENARTTVAAKHQKPASHRSSQIPPLYTMVRRRGSGSRAPNRPLIAGPDSMGEGEGGGSKYFEVQVNFEPRFAQQRLELHAERAHVLDCRRHGRSSKPN